MESPLPISFEHAGAIHPTGTPQSQDVLKRNNGKPGNGTHGQSNHLPMGFATVGPWIFQHTCMLFLDLDFGLGGFFPRFGRKPPDRRMMVMNGRIHDAIVDLIMGTIGKSWGIPDQRHLQNSHSWVSKGIPQDFNFRGNDPQIFRDDRQVTNYRFDC